MSIPSKIVKNFEPHRGADEVVVAAFTATTHNQLTFVFPLLFATVFSSIGDASPLIALVLILCAVVPLVWFLSKNKVFTIIATNDRTVVARSTQWSSTKVESIVREVPAAVKIGPPSGFLYSTDSLGDPMKIHNRMFGEIRKADAR